MAFNSAPGRAEYTATAGQTVFPFVFKIYLDGDIKVYLTPAGQAADDVADLLTITTDYTVSINGDNGGTVTLVSGASTGDSLTFVRDLDVNRLIEYQNNGDLLAETLNQDQNYQTYLIADKDAENETHLRLPDSVQGVSTELPAPISNAYFKWNADADAIENDTTIPDAVIAAAASAAAAAVSASNAATSETNAATSAAEAAASAASIDPTNIIHTDGSGEDNELSTLAVNLTTAQTVVGIKTFSSSPIVPAPTTDLQAATKKYADDLIVGLSSGKILQVVTITKTDTFSTASLSLVDVTGLAATITPTLATSKILVLADMSGANSGGTGGSLLLRDATPIGIGDAASARPRYTTGGFYTFGSTSEVRQQSIAFLDSPAATSATTYKIQVAQHAGTFYLNRTSGDADNSTGPRYASSITLLEVGV